MITVDFNRLAIEPGFRILDIGCGSGRHTGTAIRFDRVMAFGVDIDYADICNARERLELLDSWGESAGAWEVLVADTARLPFRDNFFDLIICSEVLEHLHNQRTAINELVRVLKPGHNMAVSVPRHWPEKICWFLSQEYRTSEGGHLRIYKFRELVGFLAKAGLQQWSGHWAHSIHTPYWWLKCLIGPSKENCNIVNLYHRFLTWQIMKKPWLVDWLDYLMNPILGKSLVVYVKKIKG